MTFDLNEITEDEWKYILENKRIAIKSNKFDISNLYYPGFVIDDQEVFNKYLLNIYLKYYNNSFTPPRGNLTHTVSTAIVGFAPGYSTLSRGESNWLLGPSTKLLLDIFFKQGIYPYFTNLFKDPFKDNKPNYTAEQLSEAEYKLIDELLFIDDEINAISVIFLGSYKEYNNVKNKLKEHNINVYSIWHPSYVLRSQDLIPKYEESIAECYKKIRNTVRYYNNKLI